MTTAQQLLAMVKCHVEGDGDRFLSIAEQIALDAGKAGRSKLAGDLRRVVDAARRDPPARLAAPVPLARPRGELASLMRATYPDLVLADLVLDPTLDRAIHRVVREHREREALAERGLAPRRKLLFSGPPGTGKTMTASAIAGELSLPLFTVLLDGVITKYLGESAAKLRMVFDAMGHSRGVYFFDEVDALATRRSHENDVGEARRVLTSFLQFLEEDCSGSLIIAATNLRPALDPALFRRFDAAFTFEQPGKDEARRVMRNQLVAFDRDALDWSAIDAAAGGLSQADLTVAVNDAARDAVLEAGGVITTDHVVRALRDRARLHD